MVTVIIQTKSSCIPTSATQCSSPVCHTCYDTAILAAHVITHKHLACKLVQDFVPHVEATLMATDTIGLGVLQKAKCFDCYATWHEAKMKGEMAASAAMLEAGYNLDSINSSSQGLNWRDKSQWPCAKTVRQRPQEESAALGHVEVCHPLD